MLRDARKQERIVKTLKAIIMAGGEGSRLSPLTCDCPKPMLRLMGRPLMEYAIRLVQKCGIHEIGATLGYLPDAIMDCFGDGERLDVQLRYFIEKSPLGTAGSVRQARDFLTERFIVLSGDGVTDFDLRAAVRFHEARGALATLVLVRSCAPQEYGMVVADGSGRIRAFHEKPGRSDVYSGWINTGIYILEPEVLAHIPEGVAYDFGHDLFPAMVAEGMAVYGYPAEGYWCDVGDVAAYLQVHADALDGKIRLEGLGPSTEGAMMERGCVLESPVFIAPGAHIASGARIGAYTSIGPDCSVASGASIKRSVLFSGVRIAPSCQLRGCVVGTNAQIGEGAQLFEGSAVGSRSQLGERSTLPPGVKLWPQKALAGGERAEANIVWGSQRAQRFTGGALHLDSPVQATRAAESIVAEMKPRELLIGRAASTVAAAMWHAAAAGAMAHGVQVVDAGVCSLPLLRHSLCALMCDAALLVEPDRLVPLSATGARLSERTQRAILKLLERQDFSGPFHGVTRPIQPAGCADAPYVAACAALFAADPLLAPRIALLERPSPLTELAERAFARAGLQLRCAPSAAEAAPDPDEIAVELSADGEQAVLADADSALTEVQRQLACAWVALEKGESRLLLPPHATRAVETLAQRYNAHVQYLPGETSVWMEALARKSPLQFGLQFDGLRFALSFLSELTDRGLSLAQWRARMPAACRSVRDVCVPGAESGRLLHALEKSVPGAELGGGLRLPRERGWAWLSPDDAGAGLHIVAEAADMEAARELCDFYDGEIHRLLSAPRD